MQTAPRSPQGPQSQLYCGGCRTLLIYPQGAQNVRCARCSHITSVPPPVTTTSDMAQLSCNNPHCRVQLMYPRGALQVQCSLCGTLNDAQQANQLGHVVCGGCQITLMYAHGAQSVKCAVCNHVTGVVSRPGGGGAAPMHHHQHHQQHHQQHQQYHQHPPQQQLPQHPHQHQYNSSTAPPGVSQAGPPPNPSKPMQAVLVENPPTLDEGGNEVQNVALGLTPNQPGGVQPKPTK